MSPNRPRPAIDAQNSHVKHVWSDADPTFGIERAVRRFLVVSAYVFPTLYVRHFAGKQSFHARKVSVEVVVLTKVILLVLLLWLPTSHLLPACVAAYFLAETICYLLAIVFLSDIYSPPVSRGRSFLLLTVNYVEINLAFALIHMAIGQISEMKTTLDAVYFTFVTFSTLGYGEMRPTGDAAKVAVILQMVFMVYFVFLFFANLVPSVGKEAAANKTLDRSGRSGGKQVES